MEEWREISGYEGKYAISNKGNVKSLNYRMSNKEKILKPLKSGKGYLMVGLCKNGKMEWAKIHRLVALLFIPNPNHKPQVNHINGDKNDNNVDNLEWCSNSENQIHAYKNKLKYGSVKQGKWLGETQRENLIKRNKEKAKPIEATNIENGEMIIFKSAAEAEQVLGIHHSSIAKVCRGKQKIAKGYKFSYVK